MDSKKKLQLSVIIGVIAALLVLILVAGIILVPMSATTPPVSSGGETTDTTPVEVKKYDVTGRIFGKDGKPLANTKFSIDLGPTDFTTDENGFFILKNLPVGQYTISGYDEEGNRIGSTLVQLSSDGTFTIGSYTFEAGAVVTLCFNGEEFFAVEVKEAVKEDKKEDKTESETESKSDPLPETQPEEELIVTPAEPEEDETITNLSWMADLEFDYGGYGLTAYRDPDMFYDVLRDDQYDIFNTYFLHGNLEYMVKQAKDLAAEGKKMWFGLNDLISVDGGEPATNLRGDWREAIDEYATAIYAVAGDYLQGFYFDEPSHHWTAMDFTRVTKHLRETYKRRTFVVHASPAYTTPASKGRDIIGYKPSRFDPMVISAENHKYVTDMGWWRYGSLQRYGGGGLATTVDQWTKACSLLDPNTRKWYVPVAGNFDWLHTEEETLEINYSMWRYNSKLSNFGGIMLYTFIPGALSGRPAEVDVNENSAQLVEEDYVKDDKGNYVYETNKDVPVYMSDDGKYYYKDADGNEAYMIRVISGTKVVEKFFHITPEGDVPFASDIAAKHKITRKIVLHRNESIVGYYIDKYPGYDLEDRSYEGAAAFFYLYEKEGGGYHWPRMRQYMFILGEGLQSVYKGEKTFDDITAELEAVFKPDVTKYRIYRENEAKGVDHSTQWYMSDYSDIYEKSLRKD